MPSESTQPQVPLKAGPAAARSFGRAANWTVGVAAAVLVLISVGGYFYHREQLSAIAADHLRLIVTGPVELAGRGRGGVHGQHHGDQRSAASRPDRGGDLGARRQTIEGLQGAGRRARPLAGCHPGRFASAAASKAEGGGMVSRQPGRDGDAALGRAGPLRHATDAATSRSYRPGETVHYRSLTLSRFALTADREMPVHFEILDPRGAVVPDSSSDGVTERGVASGAFTIPDELGRRAVHAGRPQSRSECSPEQKQPFVIRRDRADVGKRSETAREVAAKTPAADPGKVEVTFYPEGGELAAGLENRVYFVGRDSAGKPVRLSGMIVAEGRGDDGRDEEVAAVRDDLTKAWAPSVSRRGPTKRTG